MVEEMGRFNCGVFWSNKKPSILLEVEIRL
jgi:hypothetical protein